jgi:transposase
MKRLDLTDSEVCKLYNSKVATPVEISNKLGCSYSTVYRLLKKWN